MTQIRIESTLKENKISVSRDFKKKVNRLKPWYPQYSLSDRYHQVKLQEAVESYFEDLGKIPTLKDWLSEIRPQRWMSPKSRLLMSKKR